MIRTDLGAESDVVMMISFVIPMYNASSTILRCLDSIYGLPVDEKDFEVIVIDDCSTDNTVEMVKEYALGHSNLVLLCQPENHRQGAARNRGVSVAKGTFIAFVDSDDETDKGVVSAARLASEKNLDMVAMKTATFSKFGEFEKASTLPYAKDAVFSGIELQTEHPFWFAGPVAYIYCKSFLEQVNYPFAEGVLFEDSDFVMVHLYFAKRMAYSQDLGYIVYYRDGSTTHSVTYKNLSDYFLLGTRMLRFYEKIEQDTICTDEANSLVIKQFADGILEGARWNVAKSIKRLIKLKNLNEIRAFYDRVDSHVNRRELINNQHFRGYFKNSWTAVGIKHRCFATIICAVLVPFYRLSNLFH